MFSKLTILHHFIT